MLTIDASVWLNADSPDEPESAASRALIDQLATAGETVVVPTLLRVEVAAAIRRVRGDALLAREFADRLAALGFVRWVALDASLAARASTVAAEHGLRGADSVYAAVALTHACDLVSLDREHLTRLQAVLKVMTPAQCLRNRATAPG